MIVTQRATTEISAVEPAAVPAANGPPGFGGYNQSFRDVVSLSQLSDADLPEKIKAVLASKQGDKLLTFFARFLDSFEGIDMKDNSSLTKTIAQIKSSKIKFKFGLWVCAMY